MVYLLYPGGRWRAFVLVLQVPDLFDRAMCCCFSCLCVVFALSPDSRPVDQVVIDGLYQPLEDLREGDKRQSSPLATSTSAVTRQHAALKPEARERAS